MEEVSNKNPLLCNPETGLCEMPDSTQPATGVAPLAKEKPIHIVYFTDPICSSCWGIEPQLRKLKLEYGDYIHVEYHMGGLLPSWDGFTSGGITQPSDVAHHWDEVSLHYEMPIDGDVWLKNPLHSSYPPSVAFKAAQLQDALKAVQFLRIIREMVFLEQKNITEWPHLLQAAQMAELDTARFKTDYEGTATQKFKDDLALGKSLGVRGFPTLLMTDNTGQKLTVYGVRPYANFEMAVQQLLPDIAKIPFDTSWESLFEHYSSLTAKEFAVLTNISRQAAEAQLEQLTKEKQLKQYSTKNGSIWRK